MEEPEKFPFVGRVAQTARCVRLLGKTLTADESLSVLITGERGIGKTRFIEEIAPHAQALGYRVVLHCCQKWDRYNPFATLSALLRLLLGKPPGWTPRTAQTMTNVLSERLPQLSLDMQETELLHYLLGASEGDGRVSNLDERSRKGLITTLFGKILEQQIQQRPSLLMALDDIHHSDSLSAGYLLNANFGRGTVLMMSAPSASPVKTGRRAEVVALSPLSGEDVSQLLLGLFGLDFPAEQFLPELLKITGGNPLHLVQLLEPAPVNETPAERLSRVLEARRPSEAFEAALQRLRSLDAPSIELIKCASLIDDSFPLPILRWMMGAKFPLKKVLRGLCRQGIARVQSPGGKRIFHFRHGIEREAAYSLLDEVKREHLHAVAASALKQYYGRRIEKHLMSLAYHYEEAGDRESAASTYFQAGRYLIRIGDFLSTEEAYRAAWRLFEDGEKKLEAMAEYINALQIESKMQECLETSRLFFDLDPPPRLRAMVLANLARLHIMTGSLHEAARYAREAVEMSEKCSEDEQVANACIYLAHALAFMGSVQSALDYGKRGYRLAERLKNLRLSGSALNTLATINVITGDLREAKSLLSQSAQKLRKAGHLYNMAVATLNMGTAMHGLGEFKGALKKFSGAIELLEKMDSPATIGAARCSTASVLMDLGEYRKSLSLAETLLSPSQTTKLSVTVGETLLVKASCLIQIGRVDEALHVLEEGWKILVREGRWENRAVVARARVEAAILSGDFQKALGESKQFVEEATLGEMKKAYHEALLLRLRALLAAQRTDEAGDIAGLIEEASFFKENPRTEALAKAWLSQLAAAKGDIARTESLLKGALLTGRLDKETCALTYLRAGKAMLKAGKLAGARRHLAKARREYYTLVENGYRNHELNEVQELLGGIEHGTG
jgi:tetratricopeptide (TPR) repeat protein